MLGLVGSCWRVFFTRLGLLARSPLSGLLVVGLGTAVVSLDSSVNIDFAAIVAHFSLPIPMIRWIVVAYVLTQTGLLLTFGRISDLLGYRRVFMLGTGISTCAFIAAACSPSYLTLVASRVVQGIGAGLILSCGPALATSLFPETQRTQVLARYMMIFGLASALGPALFGPIVERFGWSAVFSFRAPVSAAAFALAWGLPRPAPPLREPFDAIGGVVLALGLGSALFGLNIIGDSGAVAATCFVIALVSFVLFYYRERWTPKPIIDFRPFRNPAFAAINLSNIMMNLSGFAILLLMPFYLSRVPGLSLPGAGLLLAVSPVAAAMAAPIAGRLTRDRVSSFIATIGIALNGIGLLGVSLCSGSNAGVALILTMITQGVGLGLFQVAYFDTVLEKIPLQSRGIAGALGMATRSVGTVMGATVLILIFESQMSDLDGFATAFKRTFQLAAAIPAGLIFLELCLYVSRSEVRRDSG